MSQSNRKNILPNMGQIPFVSSKYRLSSEPPLSFRPHWTPQSRPGGPTVAQQVQQMIEQKEQELAELRALQLKYPPPPADPA